MTDRTTPNPLIELAERCEQASGGQQRELLLEATELVIELSEEAAPKIMRRAFAFLDAGAYLNAAMLLVPEGFIWSVSDNLLPHASARVVDRLRPIFEQPNVMSATPALALTAACLRSLAQGGGRDG